MAARAERARRGARRATALSTRSIYGANRFGSAVAWLTGWPVTREARRRPHSRRAGPAAGQLLQPRPERASRSRPTRRSSGPATTRSARRSRRCAAAAPPTGAIAVIGPLGHRGFARLDELAAARSTSAREYTRLRLVKSDRGDRLDAIAAELTDAGVAAMRDAAAAWDHRPRARRGGRERLRRVAAAPPTSTTSAPRRWPSPTSASRPSGRRADRCAPVTRSAARSAPRGGDTPVSC